MYFGNLVYLYLYENYPALRKYIHEYDIWRDYEKIDLLQHYKRIFKCLGFNTFKDINDQDNMFEHPDNIYCRIDDGSFSGAQVYDSMEYSNNWFICSALYDSTLNTFAESGLHMFKVNGVQPEWVSDVNSNIMYIDGANKINISTGKTNINVDNINSKNINNTDINSKNNKDINNEHDIYNAYSSISKILMNTI